MFSASRVVASRVAIRASTSRLSVAAPSKITSVRFFAGSHFLDPSEVTERIIAVVKNFDKVDPGKVSAESKFHEDLGLDSLDAVEVVMAIEDEFAVEIPDAEADKIVSVKDAVDYIAGHPMAK